MLLDPKYFAYYKLYEQMGINPSWCFLDTRFVCPLQFPLSVLLMAPILYSARLPLSPIQIPYIVESAHYLYRRSIIFRRH